MSWKATGYVKELRAGLTVTEKFVLLMLAEYHQTDSKLSWPSTKTMAEDCLIEQRSIKRILSRLEQKGFIEREKGGGEGHTTAYSFVGLKVRDGDRKSVTRETVTPQSVSKTVTVEAPDSDRDGDPTGHAIRKERVEQINTEQTVSLEQIYEPVEEQRQGVPDWIPLEPWMEFVKMRKKARGPFTDHARLLAFGELAKLKADGNDPREVLNQSILNGWKGLFPVGQNRGNGNGANIPSKKQQLVNKNRAAIYDGLDLGSVAR